MSRTIDTYLGKKVAEDAANYEEKTFGNNDVSVRIGIGDIESCEISIYTNGIVSAYSSGDFGRRCIADAKSSLRVLERKTQALKQAISYAESKMQ